MNIIILQEKKKRKKKTVGSGCLDAYISSSSSEISERIEEIRELEDCARD